MHNTIIAPSILASDFGHLSKDIQMINKSDAAWIHIDVMDGMFVPNISFGFPILELVRKHTHKVLDVHLMIEKPERYFEAFKNAGADHITIHYEKNPHLHRAIEHIHSLDMTAGIALNPHTPTSVLSELSTHIDLVLIMSVNPGFGGQKFIPHTIEKIKQMDSLLKEKDSAARIQVDGGVGVHNCLQIRKAGASILVAGSAIFNSSKPTETISNMIECAGK